VECQPGSQQALHAHVQHEQAYVIVQGRGQMLAGAEACEVGRGTLVFVRPATPPAIRAIGGQQLVYVSATSPPFEAAITGQTWETPQVRL
jgi:mannose-6-phosphate isomerase-like protein (cupin superfamily)